VTEVGLWIDPVTHHLEADRLFMRGAAGYTGEDVDIWLYLQDWFAQRGVSVHTADRLLDGSAKAASLNVYVSFGTRHRYTKLTKRSDVVLSGFFARECPVVEPKLYRDLDKLSQSFKRMFSFSTGEALRPFLRAPVAFDRFRLTQPHDGVSPEPWANRDRRWLALVSTNKLPRLYLNELYTERLRALEYFHRYDEIDLFGLAWDEPPYRMGETVFNGMPKRIARAAHVRWRRLRPTNDPCRLAAAQAWRGPTMANVDTLGNYTFAICFENMQLDGWVTERIFDTLAAGAIPIYLGAPDIERWVSPDCYIDMRRFSSYEELRDFMRGLGPNEIEAYREAGRAYFASAQYGPFTKPAFAELLGSVVAEDAGIQL
jgi:hypothetical protein